MAHQFYFNPYILDNLPAPSSGFDVVQDIAEPRLRMYVTSRGIKTFFVRKRVRGRDRRIIIGNYPDMEIETARTAVPTVLANVMKAPKTRRNKTAFKKIVNAYMTHRVRRGEMSRKKLARAIDRHLAPLFDKNITEISTDDVKNIIENISGKTIAARMQELLRSIFNYAAEQGYITNSPLDGVRHITPKHRVRPLTRAGLQRLVRAIEHESSPTIRGAFLMLIYGFAPRSKIFSMQWRDLDFNHYTWDERPLSDMAVVLLQDLPQNGRWVFPGRGGNHLIDPRCAWRRVARGAGIPNLTMDDVNKFFMRQLVWASNKEDFRENMNQLLTESLA